jgi:mannose-6-phosphate isomerase
MAKLYPLLLEPMFVPRPWGARDLAPFFPPDKIGGEPIGEVWLTGDECRVTNGPLAGKTLAEVTREFRRELVGDAAPDPQRFPLLVKFLFPREKLSVQVHPDDEAARRAGLPCGKTECWYVLAAEPGAQIALGLKPGTTRAQFEQAIRETRAEELLNWMEIHQGEMIYVEAGTVHTIGPGSVLLETQQNSDTTYRLYDYGRPRELHVREGLAAVKEETAAGKVIIKDFEDGWSQLISSPCFVVEKHQKKGRDVSAGLMSGSSGGWTTVEVVVGLNGAGVVEVKGSDPVRFTSGEAVVVPASISDFWIKPRWEAEYVTVMVPPREKADNSHGA